MIVQKNGVSNKEDPEMKKKDSEFEDDKVLDFRCSPGYCQNQSHTNKTKSISWLELAGCVGC